MIVDTTRFGPVEVDPDRVITFAKGLLGFARYRQYVLLQPTEDGYFYWLQSVEAPELAFVVTDPSLFVAEYAVSLKPEQMQQMQLLRIEEAQEFVIANRHDGVLTGNLLGPLVINTRTCRGWQLVLSDRRFDTRVPLIAPEPAQAVAVPA